MALPSTPAERLAARLEQLRTGPTRALAVVRIDDLEALLAEHQALREASTAMLDDLEDMSSCTLIGCDYCRTLAMHDNGLYVACDEHRGHLDDEHDVRELTYATPLRALRAALNPVVPAVDGMPVEQLVQLAHDLEDARDLEASDAPR